MGLHVTALDSSPDMLQLAARGAQQAGVTARFAVVLDDATHVDEIFPAQSFDIVLCHNILEYVDDPSAVLRRVARVMRGPSANISALVRNQAGEVLKAALQAGDLAASEHALDAEWAHESLYGGKVRVFTPENLKKTLNDAALTIVARRGVRVTSDYLPSQISRSAEYDLIFNLERKLGARPEFFGMARYLHVLARLQN